MNARTVLSFIACLPFALPAPAASAQFTPRPGGAELHSRAQQGYDGNAAGRGQAFVTYLSGEPLLMSADDEDWGALSPNLPLRIGDRLWAQDDAKFEIRLPGGATAWVNYQSELDITRMESTSRGETTQLALVSGEATFDVKGATRPGSVFQVDVPNASIRASREARFRVNTLPDGTTQIGVSGGSLILETPDGFTDVSRGRMAEIQPDQRVLLDFLPARDDWDTWVRSRAEIYDRPAASRRYLPAELAPYAHEFDTSGRWITDRTHGSVWVPTVEPGWSPYANGRWVWQANDYVWLPYDPWYAPFHFGRWSWNAASGWFWIVPRGGVYWSPGYVGWSVVGDVVSWVPLGHNEVYYGYGNFGPGNVNVIKQPVVNVTNVYSNSRVANGVVAVRLDNFLRGRIASERISPSRNPFEARGAGGPAILGKPPVREIKPIRETRQPRPEIEVKRHALPPARLDSASRSIRNRVVAPTKEKSAFRPGNKPAPLKNILKERELERWVPPKLVKTPQADQDRSVQAPPGRHQFKRTRDAREGGQVAPAPTFEPEGRPGNENEEQSPEDERGKRGGKGAGKKQ